MRRTLLPLIAALILGLPAVAQATDFYTSPSGSGSTCSQAAPCGMQTGLGRLAAGDDLLFYGGTYRVSDAWFNAVPSGVSSTDWPISASQTNLRAVAGQTPVLDGGCPVANGTTDRDVGTGGILPAGRCKTGGSNGELYTASKNYVQFGPGLTFQHFDNGFGNGVFTPSANHHVRWTGNVWNNNGANSPGRFENDHDIYMAGGSCGANHDIMIDHNWMGNSPGGALHQYHYCQGRHILFQNNLVVNHAVGVYTCDDAEDVQIVNNTFVGTFGRAAITTYCGEVTGPKPVVIRNNISVRSGGTQWERSSNGQGIEDHNIWYGGSSPGTGTGDKTSNPLLDANLKPQAGSPAIDAGSSLLAPAVDYAGTPRPQGAAFDIGAFETGGGSPPPPPPPNDTTPPTPPTNLVATGPQCGANGANDCTIHVTFTPATDNVGVVSYNLYRPLGNKVGDDVGTATSTDFGGSLPQCSTQTMGLEAVDAAGLKSTVAQVTGSTYCPAATSLAITNFRRDARTDTDAGVIWFAWTAPTAPVSKHNEYRDKNGDGVLQSTDLVFSGTTTSPDVVGGSLACGTTVLVGLEAVGADGVTVGPRVQAPMATKAC